MSIKQIEGAATSAAPVTWLQSLPRSRPVRREDALVEACRGRRVVHVGFVDEPLLESRLGDGTWLHARLAKAAVALVGIDCSSEGVAWARLAGFEAYCVDAQSPEEVEALALEPADAVIAGEVIEHLDAPGPFLRAMRTLVRPDGLLVLTTPNAYRPLNALVPLSGSELIHPDHVAWHSPHTLRNLLAHNGWSVEAFGYYQNPPDPIERADGLRRRLAGHGANAVRRLAGLVGRWAPYWSDGLIVWARPLEGRP